MIQRIRPRSRVPRVDADAGIEALYHAHWNELVRLAVLLTGETGAGEEIVQDAYVALHRRWDRLADHDRAAGYLRRSVVNGCRSLLRHRTVVERQLSRARHTLESHEPADAAVLRGARREAVLSALASLPRRQREVLVLRHYLDLSEREIADALGVSRGSVKVHASRGATALRELLPHSLLEER